ncbi:MAG: tRNA guanosine(15) transglycosylase TgtA [Thaumarchaeota archaeon]|nr:tRNA guanosine(15) transglycosylase TgtA [Nitrososphaerota archaeon]
MRFAFEVKESDLLGRVGSLRVGGRSVETPCLFPVIHPVVQTVPTSEIKRMGFEGVMTNSYIMYSRRREEAAKMGVHRLVDFDGMVMTDSGGYQVLEYGDLGIGVREVAEFQQRIGSDLAVTLDKPTGNSESRSYAEETVRESLKGALKTIRDFPDDPTVWVGPVQGGTFPDLLKRSATALVKAGFPFLALGSPTLVMESYRFADLAKMIVATRESIPYSVPLHLFGAGHPLTMPLAVALGCDTFDSASYILFARRGNYITERGVVSLRQMKVLTCNCPVCVGTSVEGLLGIQERQRATLLATHNLWALRREVEVCKEAIAEGRLWDLVQERATAHPRLFEALEVFTKEGRLLQEGTPAMKERGLFVRGGADLARPEVSIAKQRLARAIRKGSSEAVILTGPNPQSARAAGNSEGRQKDFFRMGPIYGPYPVELDFVYPFTQTVSSEGVSGVTLAEATKMLRKQGYARVRVEGAKRNTLRSKQRSKAVSPSPP